MISVSARKIRSVAMGDDGSDKHDHVLQEQCQSAAWRAKCVHDWWEPLLKDSAAAKRAYAFKGRVKPAEVICDKVLGRRNHEDSEKRNPDYQPSDVTDGSGFRIVKLFNAEVPQSLDELLSLLKLKLKESLDPTFQGSKVKRVTEIEFHTSRRLELLAKRPERVSVLLRLGQLRRDAGDFVEAVKLMEAGLKASKSIPDPDPEVHRQANWLLRRDLAYISWRLVDLEPSRSDAVMLLHRSVDLSKEALDYVKTDAQFINSRQNYLYYVVDLWKRSPADQRDGLVMTGRKLLDELRPKVDWEKWTVETLDTIARGEAAFGDSAMAVAAAKVVAQKLGERIVTIMRERNCGERVAFELMSGDERSMYLHAQLLLETK